MKQRCTYLRAYRCRWCVPKSLQEDETVLRLLKGSRVELLFAFGKDSSELNFPRLFSCTLLFLQLVEEPILSIFLSLENREDSTDLILLGLQHLMFCC